VSSVGLGVQNMSRTYQTTVPSRPEMINIIRTAFDRGVTFYDAAEAYGPHEVERILGEGVAPFRDKVVITSKFGWNIDQETGQRGDPQGGRVPEDVRKRGTTADYSLWGSSAGARMAAGIGSYGTARHGGSNLPKPSALVLLYSGHSDLASTEPPTFVAVGDWDGIAPPATMERRVAALRRQGTEVEYRKYPGVGHGFGLGVGTSAEGWIADAVRFWTKQIQQRAQADKAIAPVPGQS
jgi:pimeloyl-ACP methyl ester carboxylesterase